MRVSMQTPCQHGEIWKRSYRIRHLDERTVGRSSAGCKFFRRVALERGTDGGRRDW